MNRKDPIQSARSAGSHPKVSSHDNKGAHKKEGAEDDEDRFINKISKWSDRNRGNWNWDKRPTHRNLTIDAALKQESLLSKNASDVSALQDVEDSLSALESYISEGNKTDKMHSSDVTEDASSMQDLLRLRENSKQKAKESLAKLAEGRKAQGQESLKEELFGANKSSSRPDSAGIYVPIKPFDPDKLESVRRHNLFRQKQMDERKKELDHEKSAMNFHALPMPGHVPYHEHDSDDDSDGNMNQEVEGPSDSLSRFVSEHERAPTPQSAKKNKAPSKKRPPKHPASMANPPNEALKAFFVTEGDQLAAENSSSEESESSGSNDSDIDAELDILTKKEQELLKAYSKMSKQKDKKYIEQVSKAQDPFSTPRSLLSAGKSEATPSPAPSSRKRPTSSDVLAREARGGDGPSILDLDQHEREILWMKKKEQKRMEMKLELDAKNDKDLQRLPNITKAQESWRRAKEEHTRETLRQLQHEEMKQKIQDMQEEMRIMRLEQKVSEQKILKQKLRDMIKSGDIGSSVVSSAVPSKPKKVKRRRKSSRDSNLDGVGSDSNLDTNNPSYFTAQGSAPHTGNLAEDSSVIGLATNSLVGDDGCHFLSSGNHPHGGGAKWQNVNSIDGNSQDNDRGKRRRGKLPPRARAGPSLSYSKYEARDNIDVEAEYSDLNANATANNTSQVSNCNRPGSAQRDVERSALDLLAESSMVEEPVGFSTTNTSSEIESQPFVSRGKKPRGVPPSSNLSYYSNHDSQITYEYEDDLPPGNHAQTNAVISAQEEPSRLLGEDVSMFSIKGKSTFSAKHDCQSSRHVTPTKKNNTPQKTQTQSPYGVDLVASYNEHQHLLNSSGPRASSRSAHGPSVPAVRSGTRKKNEYQKEDDLDQALMRGESRTTSSLFINSPARSRPRSRGSLGDIFQEEAVTALPEGNRRNELEKPRSRGVDVLSEPVASLPCWSECEPDLNVSAELSSSGRFLRSSRASNDLYLSDSDSRVSYNVHGIPFIESQEGNEGNETVNESLNLTASKQDDLLQRRTQRLSIDRPELVTPHKMNTEGIVTNSHSESRNVAKDPRYRHIDIYKDTKATSGIHEEDSANKSSYIFESRPLSAYRRLTEARPDSDVKDAVRSSLTIPQRATVISTNQIEGSDRFFDSSSTQDKGRFRVNDARDFHTKSMHRRPDTLDDGVTLLLGVRRTNNLGTSGSGVPKQPSGQLAEEWSAADEEVITVLFDRTQFTEDRAKAWWQLNKERILNISKFQ